MKAAPDNAAALASKPNDGERIVERRHQDWLEHSTPGDPWWDGVDFGRRLDTVPPASFIGGWYDLFLRAQLGDYEALRRAGRTARLTIGQQMRLVIVPYATRADGTEVTTFAFAPAGDEEE